MDLVVVGSVGLDDVETPFGKVERALGGSAIYFSLTAALLTRVGFVGVVGEDFPEEGVELLKARGVDVRGLERAAGKTFRWSGRYHEDLNHRDTLLTELNCFEHFSPKLPDDYRAAKYLFLGNIHPSLQLDVLDQSSASFVAMDTMNFWISGAPDDLRRVLARVDAITINDEEARDLTGQSNIVRAAREIHRLGPKLVVIKRGEYGALIARDDEYFFAPAFPLEDVVDPTGAGDSFAGGFMGYIARHDATSWAALCQATIAGSTLASFSVEAFSVDALRSLTHDQITARAAAFRRLTDFPAIVL
ncbi:MAG: sugar kinase [Myxococcales bacterium]|nr:sugar kinase [Myxococcales bacterium]MCB9520697.1 sugar kinase [Myxococcales bacterium]